MNSEISSPIDRWLAAMPLPLRPYWEDMQGFWNNGSFFQSALQREGYELEMLSLELFYWFGSGAGPWSGYPMYESIPEFLLLEIPTNHLVGSLLKEALSERHLEGATRYFSGRDFLSHHPGDCDILPNELVKQMFSYVTKSGDTKKISRFRKVFGDIIDESEE